jgi:hypothetical protein
MNVLKKEDYSIEDTFKKWVDKTTKEYKETFGSEFDLKDYIINILEGYSHLHIPNFPEMLYDIFKPILELIPIEEFTTLLVHSNYLIRELSQKEYDRRNG